MNEFSIIEDIKKKFKSRDRNVLLGIGDDAALIQSKNENLLFTTDSLIGGTHFIEDITPPESLGQKIIAINVSDIAAMGGTPKYFLLSLVLPKHITQTFIDLFLRGLKKACQEYGITVIGGNLTCCNLSIHGTLIGTLSDKPIKREGAKPGDLVMVTGTLGDAAAGYLLIADKKTPFKTKDRQYFKKRFLTPTPRINESSIIKKYATAMVDISDGLSSDLLHICDASKVGVKLFEKNIPISSKLKRHCAATQKNPLDLALSGGEDYELCFTVKPMDLEKLKKEMRSQTKTDITVLGQILSKSQGRWIVDKDGNKKLLIAKGWNHFE